MASVLSLQERINYLAGTHLPSETMELRQAVDAALRRADARILGVDFMNDQGIERAPGQYPANDPTFTRDRHLLKTSVGGNGRRLNRLRALFLNAMMALLAALGGTSDVESEGDNALCPLLQGILGADSFRAGNEDRQWQAFFQSGLPAAIEMQAEIQRVKGLYETACAAAGDEEGDDPLFATPDEGFGMETDDEGKRVKVKKLHKRVFDAIQLKRAAAQLKRAVAILAVDPKDYRALSYVAARACKQVNSIMSSAPTQRAKYGVGQFRDVVQYRFGVPMSLLRQAYSLRINTRENKATGNGGILSTCDLEGHELLNLVDVPNKRGRLYRRHEAWQNVIAWFLRRSGIGIMGSAHHGQRVRHTADVQRHL